MADEKEIRDLCRDFPLLRDRLVRAGLYITAQKMQAAADVLGYEAAAQLTQTKNHD